MSIATTYDRKMKRRKEYKDIEEEAVNSLDLHDQLWLIRRFIQYCVPPKELTLQKFISNIIKWPCNLVESTCKMDENEWAILSFPEKSVSQWFCHFIFDISRFKDIQVPDKVVVELECRMQYIFDFLYKYKKIGRILLANPKGGCIFPYQCRRFPCETLDCNGDQCDGNGNVFKGY